MVENRLAETRAERGLSRRQLATALEVHYQTIGCIQRREYNPNLLLALRSRAFSRRRWRRSSS